MTPGVLLTDLYQLTMLEAYFAEGMDRSATFEFFVRALPPNRNFLIAAGLAEVVEYLSDLAFSPDELLFLAQTGRFQSSFLDSLRSLQFTGDVDAMPEGTPCFANEPLLRMTARLSEAQLVESRIMNLLHYETLVASKAVRCTLAARGRLLVDFGLRRAHAAEAALLSARASYLVGFGGTATVEAGKRFAIPLYGTMAHSYIQSHDSEAAAFEAFARAHPQNAVLLIDTYDTERATHTIVRLAAKLARDGISLKGVRIDSGDLGVHAKRVRAILDAGGCADLTIFASSNLDEYKVHELVAGGAPINGFGVGTRMNVSADAPYLDCAYKLQEYDGQPRRKRSEGKATWPGRKQVYRKVDAGGRALRDVLALEGDNVPGAPLLVPIMRGGRLIAPLPSLAASRDYVQAQVKLLPPPLLDLNKSPAFTVTVAPSVRALAAELDRNVP
jgi:nicotinate phosphoribosyltransferase